MPAKKPLRTMDKRRVKQPPEVKQFDYHKNKELDEKFGTTANSPLHRANRFPQEYASENFNDRRKK